MASSTHICPTATIHGLYLRSGIYDLAHTQRTPATSRGNGELGKSCHATHPDVVLKHLPQQTKSLSPPHRITYSFSRSSVPVIINDNPKIKSYEDEVVNVDGIRRISESVGSQICQYNCRIDVFSTMTWSRGINGDSLNRKEIKHRRIIATDANVFHHFEYKEDIICGFT